MSSSIAKFAKGIWWGITASGLVSIVFGVAAMVAPRTVLSIFIYAFSVFILVTSAIVLGQSINSIRSDRLWWLSMLFAICGISIGLYILINPTVAQAFIAVLLAVYIFSQSLLDLIAASYSDDSKARTPVIAVGIIGVIMGFVVLFQPKLATEAMVWTIGLYILVHGLVTEYYAIKVRSEVGKVAKSFKQVTHDLAHNDKAVEAEVIETKKPKRASKPKANGHTKHSN